MFKFYANIFASYDNLLKEHIQQPIRFLSTQHLLVKISHGVYMVHTFLYIIMCNEYGNTAWLNGMQ